MLHELEATDASRCKSVISGIGPDVVYHLSGSVSARPDLELAEEALHSHVVSSHNLLMLASEAAFDRLVLCGSLTEAEDCIPSSPYSAAKSVVRLYSDMFHSLWDTPVVLARPFMTFGPGQRSEKVLPYVIRCLRAEHSPELSGGDWRADWIYIDDVIEGFYLMAGAPNIEGISLDLGRGKLIALREMVQTIADLMGSDVPLHFGARADRPDEPVRLANLGPAQTKLNWRPSVDLRQGLERTIASFE